MEDDGKIVWGYREVSKAMGISERTLRRMVLEGSFPRPLEKMLPRVRWSKVTILRWVEENG